MEFKCSKCNKESEEKETCCDTEMTEKAVEGAEENAEINAEAPKEEEMA
ncbi:MAG: hypothetical protein Q7S49_02555 [bacterium]|nr:hypothetical protein [bacterium]